MDAPWTPIYVIVGFLIHPLIGLVAVFGGAILVGLAIANERALRKRLATASEMAPRVYAAQEAEDGVGDAIRALGMSGPLLARQLERRAELNHLQLRSQIEASRFSSATKFVRLLLQSTALGVGAWLAVERQISPGALIAGSILTSRALAPLEQIVGSWRQLGEARNAYNSVRDLLAAAPPQVAHTLLPKPAGALRVERVGVRLTEERPVLAEISFAVEPGEILGVIGASGAGKSTLARAIAGAIQPDVGIVRLDDANFLDWDADKLGSHIGYLPQEVLLLAGTIAENIRRFTSPVAGDNEMDGAVAAAMAAGVHQHILRLPKGYETQLGLGGSGLSMGQAQRVALARALFGEPALLVLDEPNAHLDQEGETALLQAVTAAKARGAATIIVAHRQGPISICDRLLVLQAGRMEMIGPRDDVLARLANAAASAPRVVRSAGV
jgi:ATP-binding cassette subfamily C protein